MIGKNADAQNVTATELVAAAKHLEWDHAADARHPAELEEGD